MNPVPAECPVCQGELAVTRLHCRTCSTSIAGRFVTGPFTLLSSEQLTFIEIFVRNEGKLTRMEAELGLSYPTIRNRLHEIIRSLGYEPGESAISGLNDIERNSILENLNQGLINSEEAMHLLQESEA